MELKRKVHHTNAKGTPIPESNYLKNRIGFWALVKETNSLNNTVTVISDTGYELSNIPVVSNEWVTVDDNKNYIPSTRNLPPPNSRVFVLTPTYTASGAFVLCSGFSRGDENIRTLWAKDKSEMNDKNNCRETKTQGGWDVQEEYSNGNFSAVSNDSNIKISVNTAADSEKSQAKEVSVTAWGNEILINEDKIEIKATTGKKVKIGNNIDTLKGILNDILNILNSTLSSAVSIETETATVVPGQFTEVIAKLGQVLE